MSNSEKAGRAWVPAMVTTLLAVLLLAACGLVREILADRDVAALQDPDSLLGTFVYNPLAPTGTPGIVGDLPFPETILRLGGGLVPVVILVFLFTWASARAARAGSSFTVLLGAWLGTVVGVGLGGLASAQVFFWQNDLTADNFAGLQQFRIGSVENGLYWGALAGLPLGLVALLVWLMVRPRAVEPAEDSPPRHLAPDPDPEPADVTAYPPPAEHAAPSPPAPGPPAPGLPAPDATIPAPTPPPDDSR